VARPKSGLSGVGRSLGTCSGHVRQHRLIYPGESKSQRAELRVDSNLDRSFGSKLAGMTT
jgi:hypothetical protein